LVAGSLCSGFFLEEMDVENNGQENFIVPVASNLNQTET